MLCDDTHGQHWAILTSTSATSNWLDPKTRFKKELSAAKPKSVDCSKGLAQEQVWSYDAASQGFVGGQIGGRMMAQAKAKEK